MAYVAWLILRDHRALRSVSKPALLVRTCGFLFLMIGGCGLLSLLHGIAAGGLLGRFIALGFNYALNAQGAALLLLAIFLVGITWLTGLSWIRVIEFIGCYTLVLIHNMYLILQKSLKGIQWTQQSLIKPLLTRLLTRDKPSHNEPRKVEPV